MIFYNIKENIQQRELSWFRSYLSNRIKIRRVNGVNSNVGETEVGVLKGSCLGPLPFLIYINDLPQAVQDSKPFITSFFSVIGKSCMDVARKFPSSTSGNYIVNTTSIGGNYSIVQCIMHAGGTCK